jgi:hypothetical protein
MLEQKVEAHLLARCREMGFLCMKFTSPGRAGVPDRVVVTPARTVFVEAKRPGGKLRRLQQEVTEKMRRAGAEVHVVDSIVGVDELVESLATRTPSEVSS